MTDRASLEAKLTKAVRHINQGRRHIARLEQHIAELKEGGYETLMSRKLLAAMRETQQFLEFELDDVMRELEDGRKIVRPWSDAEFAIGVYKGSIDPLGAKQLGESK